MNIIHDLHQLKQVKASSKLKDHVDIWTHQLEGESRLNIWGYFLRPAVLITTMLIISGTSAWATLYSQPGDTLYPVKHSIDHIITAEPKQEPTPTTTTLTDESTASAAPTMEPIIEVEETETEEESSLDNIEKDLDKEFNSLDDLFKSILGEKDLKEDNEDYHFEPDEPKEDGSQKEDDDHDYKNRTSQNDDDDVIKTDTKYQH